MSFAPRNRHNRDSGRTYGCASAQPYKPRTATTSPTSTTATHHERQHQTPSTTLLEGANPCYELGCCPGRWLGSNQPTLVELWMGVGARDPCADTRRPLRRLIVTALGEGEMGPDPKINY